MYRPGIAASAMAATASSAVLMYGSSSGRVRMPYATSRMVEPAWLSIEVFHQPALLAPRASYVLSQMLLPLIGVCKEPVEQIINPAYLVCVVPSGSISREHAVPEATMSFPETPVRHEREGTISAHPGHIISIVYQGMKRAKRTYNSRTITYLGLKYVSYARIGRKRETHLLEYIDDRFSNRSVIASRELSTTVACPKVLRYTMSESGM